MSAVYAIGLSRFAVTFDQTLKPGVQSASNWTMKYNRQWLIPFGLSVLNDKIIGSVSVGGPTTVGDVINYNALPPQVMNYNLDLAAPFCGFPLSSVP